MRFGVYSSYAPGLSFVRKDNPCALANLSSFVQIVGEPEIQKLEKKWPESSRILDYILS